LVDGASGVAVGIVEFLGRKNSWISWRQAACAEEGCYGGVNRLLNGFLRNSHLLKALLALSLWTEETI
jgi:hypothetical protein